MSNPEPNLKRAASWHRPAIWAIVAVLVLAAIAFLIFGAGDPEPVDVSRQADPALPTPVAEGTETTAVEPPPPPGPVTAPAPSD